MVGHHMRPERARKQPSRRSSRPSTEFPHATSTSDSPQGQTPRGIEPAPVGLRAALESLGPHDHLCLICESQDEWRAATIPFVAIGLQRGEKCIYVVDANTARQIRRYLAEEGVDASAAERSGQITILHHTEAYTKDGTFDPDRMIAMLAEETKKALAEGYPTLRVIGEMTWVLRGHPGSNRVLEYEAKLNRDFFLQYPCVAICHYNRWEFDPEIIKGVILTHPLLIRGSHLYHNFYYVPPEEYLADTQAGREVQHWLNNLERERAQYEALREREERYRLLFEQSLDAIWTLRPDGTGHEVNQAWLDMFGYSREDLATLNAADLYADPADRAHFLCRIEEEGQIRDEVRFKRKDGSAFVCQRTVVARRDASGRIIAFQGVSRDITDRIRAEEDLRTSEEKYRALFEQSMDAIAIVSPDGTHLEANDAWLQLFGYTREQLQHITAYDFYIDPSERDGFLRHIAEAGVVKDVVQFRRSDGSVFDCQRTVVAHRDQDGTPVAFFNVLRDITLERQWEQALRESEQKYRTLFEQSRDAIAIVAPDGSHVEANEAWLQLFGYTQKDLPHVRTDQIYANHSEREDFLRRIAETGVVKDVVQFRRSDGSVFDCQRTVVAQRNPDGTPVAFFNVLRDITEDRSREQALRASEEKYRTLFEQSMDAISMIAPDGSSLEVNRAWLDLFGYSPEEVQRVTAYDIYVNPEERADFLRRIGTDGVVSDVVRFRKKDGTEFDCQRTAVAQRDSSGAIVGCQNVLRDITLERQREQAMRASEEKYRSLFEQSMDAIALVARDGILLDANPAYWRLFGFDPGEVGRINVRGHYLHPEQREEFVRRMERDGVIIDEEVDMLHSEGRVMNCLRSSVARRNADGRVIAYQTVIRDVTARKKAEQQLRESEDELRRLTTRLEAIREEERTGIARELHDQVGQALTALKIDLSTTLEGQRQGQPSPPEKLAQMIELVDATTDDVRRISSELRPGILDDFGLIAAMEWQLDQFQQRTDIQCDLKPSGDEVPDSAIATALYRVFQELLTNVARHANAQHVNVLFEHDSGDYILTVADDGRGITDEQMHSPSSLGLIGARERLRPLGGHIELSGTPGKGTTVRVTVPAGR